MNTSGENVSLEMLVMLELDPGERIMVNVLNALRIANSVQWISGT